ncbi:MAG: hypothetical protein LBQ76_01440 [Candidatus Fibromonas sp.]|jgi:hypothetical protein|nr:hypothetical protein [Candidatus Fibromonas sp.]
MLRSLLISSLCALFLACSSEDNSATLYEWFSDQGLAASYGKKIEEIEIPVKNFTLGFDNSAYMVSSYAALGNVNGMEHLLYFGLEVLDSVSNIFKLRIDNTFYEDIPGASKPEYLDAAIYWLKEPQFQHDSLWLKFPNAFADSADISLEQKADTFFVSLPEELLRLKPQSPDTLRLLVGIKLRSDNTVLRIAPPSTSDIRGLLRVAQKTDKSDYCLTCLHSGVRESLLVTFEIKDKEIMTGKTVVFAQLVLPKQSDTTGSELGFPVPVHVYGENGLEDYRVDTVKHHPNLVFRGGDFLTLQVTESLRNYAIAADSLPDTLDFTLRLGVPMLDTTSLYFYNSIYSSQKVFSDRPAYARYDFASAVEAGKTAKLKLWFADYGDKK